MHIQPGDKFYAIVRADLKPGYQAVQAAHALVKFAVEHPEITRRWNDISEYMCILSVKDEKELLRRYEEALAYNVTAVPFFEPDIGNQMTAVALEPGCSTRVLLSDLKLALR